jgi:hypothetical protein
MLDLGRERYNTEQLQKSLNAQKEVHKELIETLNKAQTTIVDELTMKGSVLASIVSSENLIQTKYVLAKCAARRIDLRRVDELSAFINTVHSRELDLPPALIQLNEEFYTRSVITLAVKL